MAKIAPKELEQRRLLGKMVATALGGKLGWLDELILRAGYLAPARLSTKSVARIFGVTPQAVGLWHAKRGCPRNGDGSYDLRVVIAWREDQLKSESADLISDSSSPALERYREEKAALARMERLRQERNLLPLDQVRAGNVRLAGILRQAGEQLRRDFGPEAAGILHEALVDFEREANQALGDQD